MIEICIGIGYIIITISWLLHILFQYRKHDHFIDYNEIINFPHKSSNYLSTTTYKTKKFTTNKKPYYKKYRTRR